MQRTVGPGVWVAAVLVLGGAGCAVGTMPPDAPRLLDVRPPDVPASMDAGRDVPAPPDASDAGRMDAPITDVPGSDAPDATTSDTLSTDGGGDTPAPVDGGPDAGPVISALWSTNATSRSCTAGSTYRFRCPPAGTAFSLWGTGEYTSDSSICTAAVHAGRITFAGGDVDIVMRPGRTSYRGSMRNGVTSSAYASWTCSFAIAGPCPGSASSCNDVCVTDPSSDSFGCGSACTICGTGTTCTGGTCGCATAGETLCGGTCVNTMTSALHCGMCDQPCPATQVCGGGTCGCPAGRTLCPTTGTTCIDTATDAAHCGGCGIPCAAGELCGASTCGARPATWTTNATANPCPGTVGMRFTYGCPAGGTAGSLWGTDTYTSDSSICTAAVHTGRISLATGGPVTIEMAPGAASYLGTTRNGITSNSYGSWTCSYVFPP